MILVGRVRDIQPNGTSRRWEISFDQRLYAAYLPDEHESVIEVEWPEGTFCSVLGIIPARPIYLRTAAESEDGSLVTRVTDLCVQNGFGRTGTIEFEVVVPRRRYRVLGARAAVRPAAASEVEPQTAAIPLSMPGHSGVTGQPVSRRRASNSPELSEAAIVATRAADVLPLADAKLPDVYYYNSLGLCVIDAIFSIGVKYESTKATVVRYCDKYGVPRIRRNRSDWPPVEDQEPITLLRERIESVGAEVFAASVLQNRQRTSARGGILKAEAVRRFALALEKANVHFFQDLDARRNDAAFESALRNVHGQGSGISVKYFWMLTGDDQLIKPDRMILGFLQECLGRSVSVAESTGLIRESTEILRGSFPSLSPRLLDYAIWEYQRSAG